MQLFFALFTTLQFVCKIDKSDKTKVFWPIDDQYQPGTVGSYDPETGKYGINYDDGDTEVLDIANEVWWTLQSSQVIIFDISSIQCEALDAYFKMFDHKDFMLHHVEGFYPHPVWNAYLEEEFKFMKTVREVPINDVPKNANVITSHVIYKIEANEDGTFKMKARIAPDGNKDRDRHILKTDCSQCPPTGFRILASISTIMQWQIAKIDFKSAFLQTGEARRDVYVIPPCECKRRNSYWLRLTSAYGLVNANAKWQEHCDLLFSCLGLSQSLFIPQLFYKEKDGNLEILECVLVDNSSCYFIQIMDAKVLN